MDGDAFTFAPQQAAAARTFSDWWKNRHSGDQIFRLFGYAGTGKTTVVRHLVADLKLRVAYAAFTGKAALMMRRSGCENASTIHALIYEVISHPDGHVEFRLNPDSAAAHVDLIVIDECSMVDQDLAFDLMSFGKPILVLGDPAQLPPVKGAGFFINAEPNVMLTEIHRQARDNPIIHLATLVREGHSFQRGSYGSSRVVPRGTLTAEDLLAADQVLVGLNATRKSFNSRMRFALKRESASPQAEDRLVCLKNDRALGIFNGGIFTVDEVKKPTKARKEYFRLKVSSDDFEGRAPFEVQVRKEFFLGGLDDLDWRELRNSQQFDYGYALTCHKSQGSQWPHVIAYDESQTFREDHRKWLYTAITRASERLTLVM
jgi:exodeoxyribonuclease-5